MRTTDFKRVEFRSQSIRRFAALIGQILELFIINKYRSGLSCCRIDRDKIGSKTFQPDCYILELAILRGGTIIVELAEFGDGFKAEIYNLDDVTRQAQGAHRVQHDEKSVTEYGKLIFEILLKPAGGKCCKNSRPAKWKWAMGGLLMEGGGVKYATMGAINRDRTRKVQLCPIKIGINSGPLSCIYARFPWRKKWRRRSRRSLAHASG